MKKLIRSILINSLALLTAAYLVAGVQITGGARSVLLAAVILQLANIFAKPLVSLLLLPVNLITLGAFRWLINVIVLYLVDSLVKDLTINAFTFPGFEYQGFIIPALHLSRFWVMVLTSFVISSAQGLIDWIRH